MQIIHLKKKKWLLWGSNPRPFGHAPEACALDHSAKQPYIIHN